MTIATANQLRLVRDACARLAAEAQSADAAGTLSALSIVLGELIAQNVNDLAMTDVAGELAQLRQIDAMAMAEREAHVPAPEPDDEAEEAELDGEALAAFIRKAIPGEDKVRVVDSKTVSRGMSKKTVLVTLADTGALPTDVVLRMDRSANNYLGTTVIEEYPILKLLWDNGVRMPQPFALEETGAVLGDPFVIFARVGGAPVGGNYVVPPHNPALIADCGAELARIHAVPVDPWPRPDQLQGRAYVDQEIDEHEADYRALGEHSPITDAAFQWIRNNQHLAYGPPVLTHNDYNFNNMLVEGSSLVSVLDWEFGHVGTAASDLGYFYYAASGASTFEAFLDAYRDAGGTVPPREQLDFYILWGQLRLVVMGFKAVRSFEDGKFDDIRFGISRWHRRQGLFRLAEFLERVKA